MEKEQKKIELDKIVRLLLANKKAFFKVLPVVFVLSCIWIFPQPRYYSCSVSLAPESQSETPSGGGLSSLASSFGLNLGSLGGSDAIYPTLYPELFESPEFLVSLMSIRVKTADGKVDTDYYTYMTKHQQKNWLTTPFIKAKKWVVSLFKEPEKGAGSVDGLNSFALSYNDYMLVETIKGCIKCSVDKKTDLISITIDDQDARVCAMMADSVKARLQDFIIAYRTSKARMDMEYYEKLTNEAKAEYDEVMDAYSKYCDSHQNAFLQAALSERDRLENDIQIKQQKYTTMVAQYEAMKSKVQERTPAFTTLKTSSIPVKPAGPKRMIFILGMLIVAFLGTSAWIIVKDMKKNSLS